MLGYLKRRFSSGDLQGEAADQRDQEAIPSFLNPFNTTTPTQPQQAPVNQSNRSRTVSTTNQTSATNMNTSYKPRAAYPSAPTSPTRSSSSSFQNNPVVESITGQISSTLSRGLFGSSSSSSTSYNKSNIPKGKYKTILVIDEPHTDWSKYFRGRKIFGDWELRVEQAQFGELNIMSHSELGCTVDVQIDKTGTKSMRSFKPDFIVVRQSTHDASDNWKAFIMGFLYSGLPALNSLHALYNMHERVWMFAHLELVRNRLGKDIFPLIEQSYYPTYKEMVVPSRFPMVIKIGNCRNGKGKIKVENHFEYQDIASIVAVSNTYATSEPFIDAKCDLLLQKIGNNFKAFQRKSLSGSWKTNTGSAILEQVSMNDKFRLWITEVSKLFGGLDMCCLKVLQSKTDEFYIYELKGSNMNLLGETQEEDRKLISELILSKLQVFCRPNMPKAESLQSMNNRPIQDLPSSQQHTGSSISSSIGSSNIQSQQSITNPATSNITNNISGLNMAPSPASHNVNANQPIRTNQLDLSTRTQSMATTHQPVSSTPAGYGSLNRSHTTPHDTLPTAGHQNIVTPHGPSTIMTSGTIRPQQQIQQQPPIQQQQQQPSRPNIPPRQTSLKSNMSVEDSDDTMKNLRKTFAGIFGDM